MTDWLLPFVTALAAGVLSSWGVGGGTLLLVAMTLLLGVEQLEAQAINLLFFLPTAHAPGGEDAGPQAAEKGKKPLRHSRYFTPA